VEVAVVDESNIDRRLAQGARGVQTAESASKDDYLVFDTFRIASPGARGP
jgi:hypothetical protein